ncbi:hypothetical protein NIES4102_04650 [Chondrocystis sp. NIES-4102]|nr:hypothetical protein NIES4102_04650 [Chondrocystis sp. NIES-4102]
MPNLDSPIQYIPEQLPLILAGPILRHTQTDEVTVWLALRQSATITLQVYDTEAGRGSILGKILLLGERQTIALGHSLHIVAVTATPVGNLCLQPERIYAYDLIVTSQAGELNLIAAIQEHNDSARSNQDNSYYQADDYLLPTFKQSTKSDSLSYFPHQLPTFALPPRDINQLKIVHGSCRKPHGGGRDALCCLDNLIQEEASVPNNRPHQLFLTGDQIYGDDVADPLLWLAQGVNQRLLGWSEALPCVEGTILSDEIMPGRRSEFARIEGGMTGMLHGKTDKAKSHLFSFGEYAAVYLLSWSPVLMPKHLPLGQRWLRDREKLKVWQQEIREIAGFCQDLTAVRRALANIPVHTICDDHDISDDWYLNREWCERVLGKPLGKRTVQNGLLTYALFQAWGNTPQYFKSGTNGEKLLQAAEQWLQSQGQDVAAKIECDRYLGIPANDPITGNPQLQPDADVFILARDKDYIPWNYTVYGTNHEVIVLDTRTWRGYPPGEDQKITPPMLLSPCAFEEQLELPLKSQPAHIKATILVLPTNLVTLGIIDMVQEYELSRKRVFSNDVGDSWNFNQDAFTTLLHNLCREREEVIILSGDIHYSCAVRLVHWERSTLQTSVLVQLTSSAIKNSEIATEIIHSRLKSLLPESSERWMGWHHPAKAVKLPRFQWWIFKKLQKQYPLPDWQYHIEWCRRQPTQSLPWKIPSRHIQEKLSIWRKLIRFIITWVWRNPWLQEGSEVVGKSNLSVVKLNLSLNKTVIQETYWYPPWKDTAIVKSRYEVPLKFDSLIEKRNNINSH